MFSANELALVGMQSTVTGIMSADGSLGPTQQRSPSRWAVEDSNL